MSAMADSPPPESETPSPDVIRILVGIPGPRGTAQTSRPDVQNLRLPSLLGLHLRGPEHRP
jgi:hypothetical protein